MAKDPSEGMYDSPAIGTTIVPSELITERVQTNKIVFPDGSSIDKVSQDYEENNYTQVPSSYALYQGLKFVEGLVESIDPNHNFFKDNATITLPLIDSNFSTEKSVKWGIKNWTVVDKNAVYVDDGQDDNYLRIPTEAFTYRSYYYLNLNVVSLDSGKLMIYDNANRVVLEITKAGEYSVELYVASPSVTTIRLEAEEVHRGDSIRIKDVNLYLVTDRLRDYLTMVIQNRELFNGITREQAVEIATIVVQDYLEEVRNTIDAVDYKFNDHITTINPHGITCELIDAAKADHTHNEFSALKLDMETINNHIATTEGNPHNVTWQETGAAPFDHTHNPEDMGAAGISHDHDDRYPQLEDFNDFKKRVEALFNELMYTYIKMPVNCPMIAKSDVETGVRHPADKERQLDKPFVISTMPYLLHESNSNYDWHDGYAQSSIPPMEGTLAMHAFSEYHDKKALFHHLCEMDNPCILRYNFHTPRIIKGIILYNRPEGDYAGFPATIYIAASNGEKVRVVNNFVWAEVQEVLEVMFDDVYTTDTIELFITRTASMGTNDKTKFSVRIDFIFGETSVNNMLVTAPNVTVNTLTENNVALHPTERLQLGFSPAPIEDNPLWVYFKKHQTTGETSLIGSFYKPVISRYDNGVNVFTGNFHESDTHPLWGTITASNEDDKHPAYNVYSPLQDLYWRSNQTLQVTLNHTAAKANPFSYFNEIEFVWTKDMVKRNTIPKSFVVYYVEDYTDDDGTPIFGRREAWRVEDFCYSYPDESIGDNCVRISHRFDSPRFATNITQLEVVFNIDGARENQEAIELSEFNVRFATWRYSPESQQWNEASVIPLGRIEKVVMPETSTRKSAYRHVGYPTGKMMNIPLQNYDVLNPGDEVIVPNPYNSTDIRVEIFSTENQFGEEIFNITSANRLLAADVTAISDTDITVRIGWTGRYGIRVVRLW